MEVVPFTNDDEDDDESNTCHYHCKFLKSIPDTLPHLVNLEKLLLGKNRIKDITPLHFLVNLEHLDLSDNKLSNIDISPFTKLTSLIIFRNYIKSLDLQHQPELQYLEADNNRLNTSPRGIQNLHQLIRLNLAANKLTTLELPKDITNLMYLNISGNHLTYFPNQLIYLDSECQFYYSNNIIAHTPPILAIKLVYHYPLSNLDQANDEILKYLFQLTNSPPKPAHLDYIESNEKIIEQKNIEKLIDKGIHPYYYTSPYQLMTYVYYRMTETHKNKLNQTLNLQDDMDVIESIVMSMLTPRYMETQV